MNKRISMFKTLSSLCANTLNGESKPQDFTPQLNKYIITYSTNRNCFLNKKKLAMLTGNIEDKK
jgi:hypothetical protein